MVFEILGLHMSGAALVMLLISVWFYVDTCIQYKRYKRLKGNTTKKGTKVEDLYPRK